MRAGVIEQPGGGAALPAGVQGDVLYHDGADWVVLNAGAAGLYLQTAGVGANPLWAVSAALPGGIQGDIAYNNGVAWVVLNAGGIRRKLETRGAAANPLWKGYSEVITVMAAGGDYTTLSAALAAIGDAAANKRYLIEVYGAITDTTTIIAKNFIDVVGYNANVNIVTNLNIHGLNFSGINDSHWRHLKFRRNGIITGNQVAVALFTGATTDGCTIHDVKFINEISEVFTQIHGIIVFSTVDPGPVFVDCEFVGAGGGNTSYGVLVSHIDYVGAPVFIGCRAKGGDGGNECGGFGMDTAGPVTLIDCRGYGGDGGNNAWGIQMSYSTRVRVIGGEYHGGGGGIRCVGGALWGNSGSELTGASFFGGDGDEECHGLWILASNRCTIVGGLAVAGPGGDNTWGVGIGDTAGPQIEGLKIEPPKETDVWSYNNAAKFFSPMAAAAPYQVVSVAVHVGVNNPGVTLDIGTAVGGNQIAANIDIGGGFGFVLDIPFSREEILAGNFIHATTSAPINDADIRIFITAVYNYANCPAIYMSTFGYARLENVSALANGQSDALYLTGGALTEKVWRIENSQLETLDPTNEMAINATGAITDAPIFNTTLVGGLTNVTNFAAPTTEITQPRTFTVNAFQYPAPGTEWTPQLEGAHLAASLTSDKCWLPLNFLKQGDSIISYRLVGDAIEAAALTLDCKLVRVNLADPLTTTDVPGGAIAQVNADGDFDVLATLTNPEVVATDKQYTLELLGTTGVGDSITVIGAEVLIYRLGLTG